MSGVLIRWDNARIILGGPARSETTARLQLAQVIYEGFSDNYPLREWYGLSECEYFHFSQMDEKIANDIASSVKYQIKGSKIVIAILTLDVTYQNSRKREKWWARIRDGVQTIEPGDYV